MSTREKFLQCLKLDMGVFPEFYNHVVNYATMSAFSPGNFNLTHL